MNVEILAKHWAEKKYPVNSGSTHAEIETAESHFSAIFPEDFKNYLLTLNGIEEDVDDENQIYFWPLIKILEQSQAECNDCDIEFEYVVFADYLISVWSYAFKISNNSLEGIYQISRNAEPNFICNTFSEFIELYLQKSDLAFIV
jgi:hypothetical protein